MEEIKKVFTETISVNKFDAEMVIASLDLDIAVLKTLNTHGANYSLSWLEPLREQLTKLLNIESLK